MVDELHYYENEKESVQQKIQEWDMSDMKGTGHAFIIFKVKFSTNFLNKCSRFGLQILVQNQQEMENVIYHLMVSNSALGVHLNQMISFGKTTK
jgi:hypothetical protein